MQFRKLTEGEKRIIDRLLSDNFSGRDAIAAQIKNSSVRQIDSDGSLEFEVNKGPLAAPKFRVPVEAEFDDIDGVKVHILLHVVEGRVNELEILKEDSSEIINKVPEPEELRLFRPA